MAVSEFTADDGNVVQCRPIVNFESTKNNNNNKIKILYIHRTCPQRLIVAAVYYLSHAASPTGAKAPVRVAWCGRLMSFVAVKRIAWWLDYVDQS